MLISWDLRKNKGSTAWTVDLEILDRKTSCLGWIMLNFVDGDVRALLRQTWTIPSLERAMCQIVIMQLSTPYA